MLKIQVNRKYDGVMQLLTKSPRSRFNQRFERQLIAARSKGDYARLQAILANGPITSTRMSDGIEWYSFEDFTTEQNFTLRQRIASGR